MKKLLLVLLLTASPAWAQTQLTPKERKAAAKGTTARVVDNCAPIGRTAKGELVYSLKCDNLPAPPDRRPRRRKRRRAAAGTGGAAGWHFRLVLRPPAIRRPRPDRV